MKKKKKRKNLEKKKKNKKKKKKKKKKFNENLSSYVESFARFNHFSSFSGLNDRSASLG